MSRLGDHLEHNPAALNSIRACLQEYETASHLDQLHFVSLVHRAVNIAEQSLYLRNDGLINNASYLGIEAYTLSILVSPGGRQFWQRMRLGYGEDIRRSLDTKLSEQDNISPIWESQVHFRPDSPTNNGADE